jgi:hypothetical protein
MHSLDLQYEVQPLLADLWSARDLKALLDRVDAFDFQGALDTLSNTKQSS